MEQNNLSLIPLFSFKIMIHNNNEAYTIKRSINCILTEDTLLMYGNITTISKGKKTDD